MSVTYYLKQAHTHYNILIFYFLKLFLNVYIINTSLKMFLAIYIIFVIHIKTKNRRKKVFGMLWAMTLTSKTLKISDDFVIKDYNLPALDFQPKKKKYSSLRTYLVK